ncbi:hypothetical protein DL768_002474 [Monosporascus sp. mg162]|nr:hypothetical protein DL768_002474 [Monosporascus sp. mg162]
MARRRVLLGRDFDSPPFWEKISPFLPSLDYITIHYAYFVFVSLAASLLVLSSSNPSFGIPYVDSLFLVISAMTVAGLNTVNLSQMTTWQQIMLLLLIIIGSSIWVSIWNILVRKHAFERRLQGMDSPNDNGDKASATSPSGTNDSAALTRPDHVGFAEDSREKAASTSVTSKDAAVQRQVQGTNSEEHKSQPHSYPPREKFGRNVLFHSLTSEDRERLSGTEYRALKLFQPGPAEANAINALWNGTSNGVSAFNNSGMSVSDANIMPYGSSYSVLVITGAMILAEKHCLSSLPKPDTVVRSEDFEAGHLRGPASRMEEDARVHYPRGVLTKLFPARQTWRLLFMPFALNGTDWLAFEVLNLGSAFLEQTPLGTRVIDGIFQALVTRYGASSRMTGWWLVLAVLLICITKTKHFMDDPIHHSVFKVVFEVVSTYGCVGITVGVPYDAFSFSGSWYPGSRLLLCLVMLRGSHRGLPVALDRAANYSDTMYDEEEDDHICRSTSMTRG